MMATTAGFIHTVLPFDGHYIRLLKFESTAPEEPLRLSLKTCKFAEKPNHNSLSYEWGTTAADQPILVNNRLFFIRENLYNFTKVLASSAYRDTYFFVDAICINQNDISERNTQVQRMGHLFAEAENVLVWLGSATAESDLIFDVCIDLVVNKIIVPTKLGKNKAQIDALDTIYQRSYWTRLWIIQELFLARNIILFCGSKSTAWSAFKQLPRWNKREFALGGFTGVDMVLESTPAGHHARDILDELDKRDQGRSTFTRIGLVDLILKFGLAQCSDVRDHVYGLLGLATASCALSRDEEDRRFEVIVDYSESPMCLFVRLLRTMPRELRIGAALELFNILELQRAPESAIIGSIPDTGLSQSFEISFTHIGHLRNVTQYSDKSLHQLLAGKDFAQIQKGERQNAMAIYGGGPLYSIMSYDSCVTASGASGGDDVFLAEDTNFVLIRNYNEWGGTSGYIRGLLCSRKSEQSIQRAGESLDSFLSYLPPINGNCLRSERHTMFKLAGPVDFIYEELSLRQIIMLLTYTGQHSDYWSRRLEVSTR
ncbi:hypothetical protein BO83DRAFT_362685 [Aspergillus eucalypticola CBS 122712]|uniref:Heterokaryon incompatibility domain-containing protein n=1 Tax=Aspergillus eucalypticola (strain CBS 122712 / IBT 29274) TaxID=1448314 RepID=A0A317VAR9_ASPEC|nr:uncharacterized protein BO83DRAFT_362685 [Aspergillus eucalypticola CBS 122712]PWY71306.1 hypothetical protein BO83DRAFT_362685 [Aspergillus eucalypticola CBS 122712]